MKRIQFLAALAVPLAALAQNPSTEPSAMNASTLSPRDAALADIGADIARGEQDKLAAAFTAGFDAGLTLDQAKEVVG